MDCPKRRCDTEAAVGLPDDPLVEILSRVPVKSLCRFKCVSKAWRDLIADPLHRKKLPQTLEGFFFTGVEHGDGYGDGEHGGTGSDDEEPPRQLYGFFDVLQRSVRTVDFSYLSELRGTGVVEETRLLHSCNGLLLFAVHYNDCDISESYIVCNPATKQCVAVPSSGLTWHQMISKRTVTSLLFNPGVRRHFNLVQVFVEGYSPGYKTSVHVYSSETQAWSHKKIDWGYYYISPISPGVYFNGMLHLLSRSRTKLTSVDLEGNMQKVFSPPCQVGRDIGPLDIWQLSGYIGQSQGCLYYIYNEREVIYDRFGPTGRVWDRLLIWVLKDYDRQHWVLKDDVSFSELFGNVPSNKKLFGKRNRHIYYNVVGIHPDHSLVFLVQHVDRKLISYNMDSKETCDLCTLGHGYKRITPYVPYFSEFGA